MLRRWERAKLMVVLGVVSNLLSLAFGQLSRSTIIIIIIWEFGGKVSL